MAYDKRAISDLYGADYNGKNRFGDTPGGFGYGHWENTTRWERIARDIAILVWPETVLELGCGRGSLVKALRDRAIDATGIDISEWSIANPIVPEVAPYISHLAAQDLSIEKRYDVIVALDIIEHIPYDFWDSFFSKLRAISSCLITTVPLLTEGMRRFNSDVVMEHYVAYTKEGWTEEFITRGYKVVDFRPSDAFPFDKKCTDNYPFYLKVCDG